MYYNVNYTLIMQYSGIECRAFILKPGCVLTYTVDLILMAGCLSWMTGSDAGQAMLTGT